MVWVSFLSRIKSLITPSVPATPHAEWLVVGLGNPGAKYSNTRHNVGYMAVDYFLHSHGAPALTPLAGFTAETSSISENVLAVRPQTFMNNSGQGVAPLAKLLAIPPERIIVIHDELDLPTGTVRVKKGGNENGHNGLKSLTEEFGTRDYMRIRIGISRPPGGMAVPDYVLGPVESDNDGVKIAAEAADLIISSGLTATQNAIHKR